MIKSIIFEDEKAWLLENLPYVEVDHICAIQRNERWNLKGETEFYDVEEDVYKKLTLANFEKALALLCEQIDKKELFVGGVTSAMDLVDPSNWDVEVVDALFQLAFHSEIIYG